MRLKSPTWSRSLRVRGLIASGMVLAAVSGVMISQTTPALADPTEELVVVGSNTTQLLWDGIGLQAAGNEIGSYDAVNPVTGGINEIITPVDGTSGNACSFARPDGSGQGVAALRYTLSGSDSNDGSVATPAPGPGCVDIARSSSGPGSTAPYTGTSPDAVQYIPFAEDAVTDVTGPASCTPSTNCPTFNAPLGNNSTMSVTAVPTDITEANDFTETDLTTLYADCGEVTEGGVTYWPYEVGATQPAGTQRIDLYVPQPGSGTLSFWETTLGIPSTLPACDFQSMQNGPLTPANDGGVTVPTEENNGYEVSTDPYGLFPYSAGVYIGQSNGHGDTRDGAVLADINSVSPLTSTGTLNTSFPITRLLYNVAQESRVTTAGNELDTLLNGTSSYVCGLKSLILNYGFALIGSECGEISASLTAAP
jgi:hypothetical protein